MKQHVGSFKLPIIFSVLLHVIIIALLCIKLPHASKKTETNVNIIQAQAISESQMHFPKDTEQKLAAPSLVQNTIRHIEQTTLKQPDPPKTLISKEVPPKSELPKSIPKEEDLPEKKEVALQDPKVDEKAELIAKQKKIEEQNKKTQEIAKQAELKKKRQAQEAEYLKNELDKEAQQVKAAAQVQASASENDEEETEVSSGRQLEEQKVASAAPSLKQAGETDKYKQMIVQTISRKWVIPETEDKNLACQLLVHLGPGGIVLSVDVIKESGDENLDRSARNAIMKASPLPVPEDLELFDNFRALRLTFRPQGIISG